jgi:hypothetical protein
MRVGIPRALRRMETLFRTNRSLILTHILPIQI